MADEYAAKYMVVYCSILPDYENMNEVGSANSLTSAVQWIEQTLSGSAATILGTVAIAGVGIMLLSGRVDVRRAACIILGCFMIFGAASIARGLMSAARETLPVPSASADPTPTYIHAASPPHKVTPPGYDPYAGAALAPH